MKEYPSPVMVLTFHMFVPHLRQLNVFGMVVEIEIRQGSIFMSVFSRRIYDVCFVFFLLHVDGVSLSVLGSAAFLSPGKRVKARSKDSPALMHPMRSR